MNPALTPSPQPPFADLDPERLRELLRGMQTVLDQTGAYIFTKDAAGRYLYANDQVCQLFGAPREQILGRDDSLFFDLTRSSELIANDRRVLLEGCTLQQEERNVNAATGEELVYWTVKSPVRNEAGETVHQAIDGAEDLRQCLDAGMDARLSKPLERVKLLSTLQGAIAANAWLSNDGAHAPL